MASNINSLRDQNPPLIVKELQDIYVRKNFEQLRKYFNEQNQLFGFKYFEVVFSAAQTNYRQGHGLPTNPQDIIVTNITGDAQITFNKGLFSNSEFDMTVTGACKVCFFLGTYWNRENPPTPNPKDTQTFNNGASSSSGALAGEMKIWPGPTVPDGYVLCDGRPLEASAYPALAKALWDPTTNRYAWGGNGQYPKGTFNVPDMRGQVPRGLSADSDTDPDRTTRVALKQGGNDGNRVGSYQGDAQKRLRGQTCYGTTHVVADGVFQFVGGGNVGSGTAYGGGYGIFDNSRQSPTSEFETRMRNVAVNYIIKT